MEARSNPATAAKPSRKNRSERLVRLSGPPTPIPIAEKALLTYEDVASLCGLSVYTTRQYVRESRGPTLTLVGKHHRFHPKDVKAWIDEMRANSGAAA